MNEDRVVVSDVVSDVPLQESDDTWLRFSSSLQPRHIPN